jgi:toxin HigB-1
MEIASIRHKSLKRLFLEGHTKSVIEAERLIDIFAFIASASHFEQMAQPPNYGFHSLTGNRKRSFAMTITRNWRLTFTKIDDRTIGDLDLEDYH